MRVAVCLRTAPALPCPQALSARLSKLQDEQEVKSAAAAQRLAELERLEEGQRKKFADADRAAAKLTDLAKRLKAYAPPTCIMPCCCSCCWW
mmetsp:Transcript_38338/g.96449  ORF Transcript_38338/g.96449 Transcript_38338/m.96449 type:complete len:92 (-) Transcript_38338:410-685(-)